MFIWLYSMYIWYIIYNIVYIIYYNKYVCKMKGKRATFAAVPSLKMGRPRFARVSPSRSPRDARVY